MSIDLEQLRQSAFAESPSDAVVTRAFLRQVHAELTAGRVAQAQLGRMQCMDEVVQGLRNVPSEKAGQL